MPRLLTCEKHGPQFQIWPWTSAPVEVKEVNHSLGEVSVESSHSDSKNDKRMDSISFKKRGGFSTMN